METPNKNQGPNAYDIKRKDSEEKVIVKKDYFD